MDIVRASVKKRSVNTATIRTCVHGRLALRIHYIISRHAHPQHVIPASGSPPQMRKAHHQQGQIKNVRAGRRAHRRGLLPVGAAMLDEACVPGAAAAVAAAVMLRV